jgi:potassium uptake protein ktrB
LPPLAFRKAAVVVVLAIADIVISTFILLLVCPELSLAEAFTEMMSAFTTVGLSLGTTASLNEWGKLISILVMLTGRMGPMTIATAWYFYEETRARYPEGNVTVG